MGLNFIFCSYGIKLLWLQNYLLPCPFKKLTGIDCPGCGFQRSVLAMLQGDFYQSIILYPATIPLLAATVFTVLDSRFVFDRSGVIKKTLYLFTGSVVLISYLIKMSRYI
jgi:hypothetical protein